MVTIIDYGIGNLRSLEKAFQAVGVEVLRTDCAEDLDRAERLVLPGVGAFGACANEIHRRGLDAPIRSALDRGLPFLGVCVGMQLLFEVGEEYGAHKGLGVLPGNVIRFNGRPTHPASPPAPPLKVPHMGWNTITVRRDHPLLEGLDPAPYFYFVHSFHAAPSTEQDILATTNYGLDFPAVVGRNNIFGVQFHPEKSQRNGLQILENFAKM